MILHVDMDAFYASVEQRDRPKLRGRPVVVGGSAESRGVVSAASYEARKFGIHSAMPTAVARRLCPHAVFMPVRMSHYVAISRQIREILESFTPLVEPLSLDEAFLDVHGCEGLFGPAPEIARSIKRRIRAATDLIASVGVAPNKFVAKLASDHGKPDGLVVVEAQDVTRFLGDLPVGRIWGVGTRAEARLEQLGIHSIGQLRTIPEEVLVEHFGELGRHFQQLALGIDDRTVVPDSAAKSISSETTFARDIADRDALRTVLLELTEQVAARIRHNGLRAHTIVLKLRTSQFVTHTRSITLREPTDVTQEIWTSVTELFDRRVPDSLLPARLVGVGSSGFETDAGMQQLLFHDESNAKHRAADQATDAIRSRFGDDAIRRGGTIRSPRSELGGERGA